MSELRVLQGEARQTEAKVRQSARVITSKELALTETRKEKALVERCLRAFAHTAGIEGTTRAIFEISKEQLPCSLFSVFLREQDELKPLIFLDSAGTKVQMEPAGFPHRDLLRLCWKNPDIYASSDRSAWLFPLHNLGALLFSGVWGRPSKEALELTALLADQAAFGFRAARLFESEKAAREAAEQAQERLRESQSHLVQSSKMAAVGQLAAGMAHELNTPLAAVVLGLGAGKRSLSKNRIEDALEKLRQCEEAADKAQTIVDQLLTHSRRSSGPLKAVELEPVVKATLEFLKPQVSREGVKIHLSVQKIPLVSARSGDIDQILTNLILNARDAVLTNMDSPREIMVRIMQVSTKVHLEVEDNGPGISEPARSRIFEPFYTEKAVGRGTGLGLYISQELAVQNNGLLELGEKDGQGALFRLVLPL